MENLNDPQYLQGLINSLQQQRNQANDTIAHLAVLNSTKDQKLADQAKRIADLEAEIEQQKQEIVKDQSL
jgi:hypothetical protein